jgi:hypothetical protein
MHINLLSPLKPLLAQEAKEVLASRAVKAVTHDDKGRCIITFRNNFLILNSISASLPN